MNVFCAINESGALQNNCVKNDFGLRVPLLTSYATELQYNSQAKTFSNLDGRYIKALGWNSNNILPSCFPLTILQNPTIQASPVILV